ncbi:MAG TPA: Zn-binding domain-containing protein, partial [Chloroflexota bacterium]|nr:Zn-binding domain-containing protein [Chloroflexota bacterium]
RKVKGDEEYLSRARFVAISEYGPRTIIYHEGSRYRVTRVVLPREEGGSRTRSARFCTECGYGHFADRIHVDRCDRCDVLVNGTTSRLFDNLLPLESVSTRRVDRITCDEEERVRMGYEVQTIYRFASKDGVPATTPVVFSDGEGEVARGSYGPSATLWRVNLGWNRRQDPKEFGFSLDMETGKWEKSDQEPDANTSDDDPLTPRSPIQRVVPFVADTRNVFVLAVNAAVDPATVLSLMYALKRGIEAHYQLESSELAAEPLPTDADPKQILFYEAAEGGAGVLVRLAREPGALAAVAREALALCHFDPDTGADLRRAPRAREDCEAGCYDCLLSYNNQRYHGGLDRQLVRNLLMQLSTVTGAAGAQALSREDQREQLLRLCQSELERDFIRWLDARGHRLPDEAQTLIVDAATRPDFLYREPPTCVYVDGPVHEYPERQSRDAEATQRLESLGYTVVRVQGADSWNEAVRQYRWIFGEGT